MTEQDDPEQSSRLACRVPLVFGVLFVAPQESGHLGRQLGFEPQRLAGDWVLEAEQAGVQGEPFVLPTRMGGQFRLVTRIAQNRMPRFGEMDANLVPAARFEADLHQRRIGQPRDHPVMRDRPLADRLVVGRKAIQVFVGRQQALERAVLLLDLAGHDGDIFPLRLIQGELVLQIAARSPASCRRPRGPTRPDRADAP